VENQIAGVCRMSHGNISCL